MKENTDVRNVDFGKVTYLEDMFFCSSRLVRRNGVVTKLETRPVNYNLSINSVNSALRERKLTYKRNHVNHNECDF